VTASAARIPSVQGGRASPVLVAIGFGVTLIVVAIGRLALFGWAEVAADDARYLYVGLSTLDGHGPVTPSGSVFLLRSPVYGIALAAASAIGGGDPVDGARVVALALSSAAVLVAVALAWRLGGAIGAAGTAFALLAMPLIWRLVPTLRIDLPQAAGVCAVILALHRPTVRRWALAGALFGFTVLVKETILLLALAPLAFVGAVPTGRFARLWSIFLVVAAAVAGWWWILVFAQSGAIFPLNAIGVIERRDVGADIRLDLFGAGLLAAAGGAWLIVIAGAFRDRGLRLLVVAAACLVPPAAYATLNGLNARNYADLAVLSAIAIGVAAGRSVAWFAARRPADRASRVGLLTLAAAVGLGGATAGQVRVGDPSEPRLPAQVVDWLRTASPPGSRVVMTFRYNEVVAVELYGHVSVPNLSAVRVDAAAPLGDFLWLGLRDRQLFGYTRAAWEAMLRQPGTSYLVLAGPHPLTPAEQMHALDGGTVPGLERAQSFEADGDWATIYRVDPSAVRASVSDVAPHLSPAAALAWIDLQGGTLASGADEAAAKALADAGTVVIGPDRAALASRLAGLACLVPAPADGADAAKVTAPGPDCEG
jgi:hypothetical protein